MVEGGGCLRPDSLGLWLLKSLCGGRAGGIADEDILRSFAAYRRAVAQSLRSSVLKDTEMNKTSFPLTRNESSSRDSRGTKKERTNRNLKGAVRGVQTRCLGVQQRARHCPLGDIREHFS